MKNTDTTKVFADRLSELIRGDKEKNGTTIKQLAKKVDISMGALSKYQNDEAEIGINGVVKLADYFHVSADYLLGLIGEDCKSPDPDIKEHCKYTGLSERAVFSLNSEVEMEATCVNETGILKPSIYNRPKLVSFLIEEYDILSNILSFFEDDTDEKAITDLYISKNGEKCYSWFATQAIINTAMLSIITDGLKDKKAYFRNPQEWERIQEKNDVY